LKWTNDSYVLSVQVLNRDQRNLDLIFFNAKSTEIKVVLNKTDEAYVKITDNLSFLANNSFIWTNEKDGWNHIYFTMKIILLNMWKAGRGLFGNPR